MQYADALKYLDEHSSYERTGRVDSPSTSNIEKLLDAIGNPQHSYRSIHITGTNGKGSTAQIITKLLMAHGLRVGTYSSPHINRINDRICINGEPIDDPGRSSADVQRCTDVALDGAGIRFQFDDLTAAPRLAVSASPQVAVVDTPVRFRMYSNYGGFIHRAEVRIHHKGQSPQTTPLAGVALDPSAE